MKFMKKKVLVGLALTFITLGTVFYYRNVNAFQEVREERYSEKVLKDIANQTNDKKENSKENSKSDTTQTVENDKKGKEHKEVDLKQEIESSKGADKESVEVSVKEDAPSVKADKEVKETANVTSSSTNVAQSTDSVDSNTLPITGQSSNKAENAPTQVDDSAKREEEQRKANEAQQALVAQQEEQARQEQERKEEQARQEAQAQAERDAQAQLEREQAAIEAAKPKYQANSIYINGNKVSGNRNGNVFTNVSSSVFSAGAVMITDGNGHGQTISIGSSFEVSNDNIQLSTGNNVASIMNGSYGVVFISTINSYAKLVAQGN